MRALQSCWTGIRRRFTDVTPTRSQSPMYMTLMFFAFSLYLLLVAMTGAFFTELPRKVRNLSFVYFGFSLTAQLLALPFLLISAILCALSLTLWTPSPWLAGVNGLAALLFAVNLWRSYLGMRVLDDIIPGAPYNRLGAFLSGGLLPFRSKTSAITRIADVAYGEAGVKNTLDIYVPAQKPATPMPVIIHIHGGAWVIGHKKQQAKPLIRHMVSKGWIAVDINYRLGPKYRFPVIYSDVLRAIAWVKTHIADYGGDPGFIASTGGSAGGHLTALSALMPNNPAFKSGFEDVDCRVDAAVPIYGVYDFLDRTGRLQNGQGELESFLTRLVMTGSPHTHRSEWDAASPMGNLHEDAPPMLVIHGRHDALAAFKNAEIFVEALSKISNNEVVFAALPGAQHAYDLANGPPTPAHIRAIERFLENARVKKRG